MTIDNNTSANFNITVTGGISPYTINYTFNGISQAAIINYVSGTDISTGNLTTGIYVYSLTSVTDATGCTAEDLGTSITITVREDGSQGNSTETLFTTEIPETSSHDRSYDLGTEFEVLSSGTITGVRLYSNLNEGGTHTIRIWVNTGSSYTLAAGPYSWNFSSGIQGWREYSLATPVPVTSNTRYIISVTNSSDYYYSKSEYFISSTENEYIRYIRGIYTTNVGSVPSLEYRTSCYFRALVSR
jgi:hypothetical protein